MSEFPPPTEFPPADPVFRRSRLAVAARIVGIIAVPTACYAVGIPLGIAAVILGCKALARMKRDPFLAGKGLAITGIVLGGIAVVIMPAIVGILIISLGRSTELANRSMCGASLTGIVRTLNMYSAENMCQFPVVLQKADRQYVAPSTTGGATGVSGSSGSPGVVINGYYNASKFAAGDPMASLWILVLKGNASSKQFICRSDPAAPLIADLTDTTGNYYYSFGTSNGSPAANCTSYSMAYPWVGPGVVGAYWKASMDSSLPLLSDMAPKNGTGGKNTTVTKGGAGAPGIYNSANHQGAGQNVAFADAHVEWQDNPWCGQGGDNIWCTGTPQGTQTPNAGGTGMAANPSNTPPYDLIFVPIRDVDTNVQY